MSEQDYKTREALLYMIYDKIVKVCDNRFLTDIDDRPVIIDVDNNVLVGTDAENIVYAINGQIFKLSNRRDDVTELILLDSESLEEVYSTQAISAKVDIYYWKSYREIESFISNTYLNFRKLGNLIIININRKTIILNKQYKVVIHPEILDCTNHKIWFSNGYHIRYSPGYELRSEIEDGTHRDTYYEIVTDYEGNEIIQVAKQHITQDIHKTINIETSVNRVKSYSGYYDKTDFKLNCTVHTPGGSTKGMYITDAFWCSTARDVIIVRTSSDGCVLDGCVDKLTGKMLVPFKYGVCKFIQLNKELYAIVYKNATDHGVEIYSTTKGTIIDKGIINEVKSRFTFLPLHEFVSYKYGTFILGNDYKLYSFEQKDFSEYTVRDIQNAYNVNKLSSGEYELNLLGERYLVTEYLRLLMQINTHF